MIHLNNFFYPDMQSGLNFAQIYCCLDSYLVLAAFHVVGNDIYDLNIERRIFSTVFDTFMKNPIILKTLYHTSYFILHIRSKLEIQSFSALSSDRSFYQSIQI